MKRQGYWTWEYDNDTGPRDEGYRAFYNLYCDDVYVGELQTEELAVMVTNALNSYPLLLEGIKNAINEVTKPAPQAQVVYQVLLHTATEAAQLCKTRHEKII